MDYFDILLAKKLEDDRDPKVEGLSVSANGRYHEDGVVYDPVIVNVPETPLSKLTVTENGTYTAPSGTAYNEVDVDVPLPENAYLLKDIENTPTAIASFSDGSNLPMPKLEVAIEPVQDLHGYDNPWVGGAGKNKLDQSAYIELASSIYNNGVFTATSMSGFNGAFVRTFNNNVVVNTVAKGATQGQRVSLEIVIDDTWDEMLIGYLMTATNIAGRFKKPNIPNGTYTISFMCDVLPSTSVYGKFSNIQLELGSTATSFAPYSNICPIIGWDEVNVSVSGVNVWDEEWEVGTFVNVNGVKYPSTTKIRSKNPISVKPNTTYYYYVGSTSADEDRIWCYDADMNYIRSFAYNHQTTIMTTFTTPANCAYINISIKNTTYNHDISINYPSTDTSYHAYNGQTYTIDLDGTRYGGKVDLVSGVMVLTDGYIASYNGETLPSTWISDRDVYSEGTSPTTGAEVVYKLATPLTIQLPTTVVKSLKGVNNVWADSGNILDLSYLAKEE